MKRLSASENAVIRQRAEHCIDVMCELLSALEGKGNLEQAETKAIDATAKLFIRLALKDRGNGRTD